MRHAQPDEDRTGTTSIRLVTDERLTADAFRGACSDYAGCRSQYARLRDRYL